MEGVGGVDVVDACELHTNLLVLQRCRPRPRYSQAKMDLYLNEIVGSRHTSTSINRGSCEFFPNIWGTFRPTRARKHFLEGFTSQGPNRVLRGSGCWGTFVPFAPATWHGSYDTVINFTAQPRA